MRIHRLSVIGAILFAAVATWPHLAAADDIHPLEGAWTVISSQTSGKPEDDAIDTKVVFDGDKVTLHRKSGEVELYTITINPSVAPAAIDFQGRDENRKILGIYELTGDQLKICFRKEGDRPAEFTSTPDSHVQLVVLRRNKK